MRSFIAFGSFPPIRVTRLRIRRQTLDGLAEETWQVSGELDLGRQSPQPWLAGIGTVAPLSLDDQAGRTLLAFGATAATLLSASLVSTSELELTFSATFDPADESGTPASPEAIVESFSALSERSKQRYIDLVPLDPSQPVIRQITGSPEIELTQDSWRRGLADFPDPEAPLFENAVQTHIRNERRDGQFFTHASYTFKPITEATP